MPLDISGLKGWLKTAVIAGVGGGIAGACSAAINPELYRFPQDFGSGKLWKYFFSGAAITLGALLLKSPLGQKLVGEYKETQASLQQSQATLQQAKSELKDATPPTEKK